MFEEITRLIGEYDKIILHRHYNPDGDALGSQLGLAALIRDNFPQKEVFCVGDRTKRYDFMLKKPMDELSDGEWTDALAIVLDCPTTELVFDKRFSLAKHSARIDHHIYCETFTDTEVVETTFESCAGMVAAMAKEAGWTLSVESATAIYTGMVTDSGRFRYDSTSARTFEMASFLFSVPIDLTSLYASLYTDDLTSVKTRAEFVRKITLFEDSPVAYIYTDAQEISDLGLTTFAASRGMVNVMSDIRGIDIWVNFTESEEGVLCEIRSSKYNINPIAVKYGGGGHAKASGATVKDRDEANRMLADLKKLTKA